MKKQEMYAVLSPREKKMVEEGKEYTETIEGKHLNFFATKTELETFLIELSKKITRTNQSHLEFSRVFPKNSVHPTDYNELWEFRKIKLKNERIIEMMGDYFVQRTLPNGKIKSKHYSFLEDLDYQLDGWKTKGNTNIYILDEKFSHSASYYYQLLIKKQWGEKEELFV